MEPKIDTSCPSFGEPFTTTIEVPEPEPILRNLMSSISSEDWIRARSR